MTENRARCEIFSRDGQVCGRRARAAVDKESAWWSAETLCSRRWHHASIRVSLPLSALIVVQLIILSCFSQTEALTTFDTNGAVQRRSLLQINSADPNCTQTYTVVAGETCASLRSKTGLSMAQLREVNPELNCKTLKTGQAVCVRGFPERCQRTMMVTKGPATNATTCASITDANKLSTEGFQILNPGLSCPEYPGNNNSWPSSEVLCVSPGLGRIFMEYMGASGGPITFDDVKPLVQSNRYVVYHVILAFALDNGQNGTFKPLWSPSLDPMSALAFKADNPGVQILVSIGGSSKNKTVINGSWVDPANPEQWINNAEASLTQIARTYGVDGLDISYEDIHTTTNGTFAYCIGSLIERLKANNTIGLATIAPFENVLMEYSQLMNRSGDSIDYVNYQFYRYQLLTAQSYAMGLNNVGKFFVPWKLLASTEIGGNNTITGAQFQTAVMELAKDRGLPGVMLWDADQSLPFDFAEEKGILPLLNGAPYVVSPSPEMSPTPPPVA